MELTCFGSQEAGSGTNYSRKQKSLGVLCSNFLGLYNREGVECIGVDDAASRLGVERRRIYDIVNVLESVGVLARKAKNQYTWKGFKAIPATLEALKKDGLKIDLNADDSSSSAKNSDDEEDNAISDSIDKSSEHKREKSLSLLTQNFLKLFLCLDMDMVSLDDASKLLLMNRGDPARTRGKQRRIYDIANVLAAMKFIEKTQHTETKKPAFRWLWPIGKQEKRSDHLVPNEPIKRSFGTDLTNTILKRGKTMSKPEGDLVQGKNTILPTSVKSGSLDAAVDKSHQKNDLRGVTKSFQFGPFAPINVHHSVAYEDANPIFVQDLERLSTTYRPQYNNPGLKEVFDHYVEAWKSWHDEVAEKKS